MTTAPALRLTPGEAYRMRLKRRRLLWRAFRARRVLTPVQDRTGTIRPGAILLAMVVRNEATRLPHFLDYYRALGIDHILAIDNDSDDGTAEMLAGAPDVSLWRTGAGYRAARFGLDWLTWLQIRHADDHWCLTVDADELLVYDGAPGRDLRALTGLLDGLGQRAFGALMLDLYPDGPLGTQSHGPGQDPLDTLTHYDPGPFRATRQRPMGNLWVQGGARERVFFTGDPVRSPTLNKLPLVRWNRRWVFANSTHTILPAELNAAYDGPGDPRPSGVLLHTKFLPEIVSRSEVEADRRQHFHDPEAFAGYYADIAEAPDLMHPDARRYAGPEQLVADGLMSRIDWP